MRGTLLSWPRAISLGPLGSKTQATEQGVWDRLRALATWGHTKEGRANSPGDTSPVGTGCSSPCPRVRVLWGPSWNPIPTASAPLNAFCLLGTMSPCLASLTLTCPRHCPHPHRVSVSTEEGWGGGPGPPQLLWAVRALPAPAPCKPDAATHPTGSCEARLSLPCLPQRGDGSLGVPQSPGLFPNICAGLATQTDISLPPSLSSGKVRLGDSVTSNRPGKVGGSGDGASTPDTEMHFRASSYVDQDDTTKPRRSRG